MTDCMQCGKCCQCDFFAYTRQEDIERWRDQGREDILKFLENESPVWTGDRLISARDGRHLRCCPFLSWENDKHICMIYDTRPCICREYEPGSSQVCPQSGTARSTKEDKDDN